MISLMTSTPGHLDMKGITMIFISNNNNNNNNNNNKTDMAQWNHTHYIHEKVFFD